MIDLSIIIVNWNTKDLLRQCLHSLYNETQKISFEVFVVDNASTDGSLEMLEQEFPKVNLIRNIENLGFAKANNQAIRHSKGRYILLLNPDTLILDNALAKMVNFMDVHPKLGAVGCKILKIDGTVDFRCARRFPTLATEFFEKTGLSKKFSNNRLFGSYLISYWGHGDSREVNLLTGACMMIRREAIEQVGLLDEDFFMYGEDVEWCYRIQKAGWKVFYYSDAEIIHLGGQSSESVKVEMSIEALKSMNLFFKKRYGPIYAWTHRSLILLITLAKELLFLGAFLATRNAKRRSLYRGKIAIHRRVLRWAFTGR